VIEQAMIFALGFCVAGLAALLFLPAITRRATTMAREQVERQMPLSIDEIVAQRDLLRAEFAAERRKIEQTVERLENERTHDLAELGRRAVAVGTLGTELGDMKRLRASLESELIDLRRNHHETTAENFVLHKSLFDEAAAHQDISARHSALSAAHHTLGGDAETTAGSLAETQAALDETTTRLEATERDLMQNRLDLSLTRQSETNLVAQLAKQEAAVKEALARINDMRARQDDLEGGVAPADLAALRRAITEIGEKVVQMADGEAVAERSFQRQTRASLI
jgi:chromosome segregation ATPase